MAPEADFIGWSALLTKLLAGEDL
ncbi:MAG: hypothetical protein RLZ48_947, partial [Actinomycetota bacterium]